MSFGKLPEHDEEAEQVNENLVLIVIPPEDPSYDAAIAWIVANNLPIAIEAFPHVPIDNLKRDLDDFYRSHGPIAVPENRLESDIN